MPVKNITELLKDNKKLSDKDRDKIIAQALKESYKTYYIKRICPLKE